jgi:hypothetical protein
MKFKFNIFIFTNDTQANITLTANAIIITKR